MQVDPKRIEALANEDPPPYEPTDVYENRTNERNDTSIYSVDRKGEVGVATDSPTQEEDADLVEEYAEEERRAGPTEAGVMASGLRNSSRTAAPQQEAASTTASRSSLWADDEIADDNRENLDATIGIFPDGDDQQPSMEDFFHDQYDGPMDDEDNEEGMADNETTFADKTGAPPIVAPGQTMKAIQPLLPKRATMKSKRPKIRPSVRKKKA